VGHTTAAADHGGRANHCASFDGGASGNAHGRDNLGLRIDIGARIHTLERAWRSRKQAGFLDQGEVAG
jgi:hypothetical protein